MPIKARTAKKMLRKQMALNAVATGEKLRPFMWYSSVNVFCRLQDWRSERNRSDYSWLRGELLGPSPGFLRLAKVEYDAKFKAALRDKLPAEVVDEIADTVLSRLEGEYWRV